MRWNFNISHASGNGEFLATGRLIKKAGLASGLLGDEVYYALTRDAQKCDATNFCSLSEPRRKQNLYANPKTDSEIFTCPLHPTPLAGKCSRILIIFSPVLASAINTTISARKISPASAVSGRLTSRE